jgi:ADP-ribosylglycohydrolase
MLGAICGDVIGSRHEHHGTKTTAFELLTPHCRWTDDTVCTVAVAEALLDDADIGGALASWTRRHPGAGYGFHFWRWSGRADRRPYGSWGNGSAMRVSAAGWLAADLAEAAELGARTAAPTHDHHHGVRGASAVAVAIRMALEGWQAQEIRDVIESRFGYDLSQTPDAIRPHYTFQISCQDSVPQALVCALSARSFEEAVRLAVSLGGDADTQAAIAGSVAEPLFGGVPEPIASAVLDVLTPEMRAVYQRFQERIAGKQWTRTDPAAIPHNLPSSDDRSDVEG